MGRRCLNEDFLIFGRGCKYLSTLAKLVSRYHQELSQSGGDGCVLSDQFGVQPLVGLYRCTLADSIDSFLDQGSRRVDQWLASIDHRVVPVWGECDPLKNINTLSEFES